eukprot:TRINITY_DN20441_c0_g1_i2.p1 TRINITY_DN20441_c0_g1~~TRINITY_DN20441_c0_g1_i2.p1  ORF type:complete len:121 (-),score=33.09 TRINITY_DN20441_c0_g1_i2:44-406(-)
MCYCLCFLFCFFFFFSSRRRHTRCREVSWARRCVQETVTVLNRVTHFAVQVQQCRGSFQQIAKRFNQGPMYSALIPVSYTHLRAHETSLHLVCRLLLEKKKKKQNKKHKQQHILKENYQN